MNTWYYYWLTRITNIGHTKIKALLDTFNNDPLKVYQADYGDYINLPYLSKQDVGYIVNSKDPEVITNEIERMTNANMELICIENTEYPKLLREIHQPPYILYRKGKVDINRPCIGIVGSRKCSEYGYTMAHDIAKELAKAGVIVISGLAKGIDTAAHVGALAGGQTVAILANGLNKYYPPTNTNLQKDIVARGCIFSEHPIDIEPRPGFFPARNRIISGVSRGILVVEAAQRSGSLITANLALEQNRDVFAVPGNAWSNLSLGSNKIIQSGAKLVMSAEDILEEIQCYLPDESEIRDSNQHKSYLNKLAQDEIMVYDYLRYEPLYIDEMNSQMNIPIATLQYIITSLELKGLIKKLPGQRLVRMK